MTEKEFYSNCLSPIKVYDSYVSCGQCANCKINELQKKIALLNSKIKKLEGKYNG